MPSNYDLPNKIFYNGQIQQKSFDCLNMLIGVSLSDILFSFMLEKYIVCDVCGLRSLSESSSVLVITSTYTYAMQELIMQGMQQSTTVLLSM